MAPFRPWAGIPPDLVVSISERVGHFETYCRARGVCTAWRAAIPPPIPSLLTVSVPPDGTFLQPRPDASALFLPAGRSFLLTTLAGRGCRCVGSSNGWLAIGRRDREVYLQNPVAGGRHLYLLPLGNGGRPVAKVVFAPDPTPEDYVAVAICDLRRLAYTKTRDMKWFVLDVAIGDGDRFVDLAFDAGAGEVYCVTALGDVWVLHIPRRQRRRPLVEPLQPERAGVPFDPAAAYAPPYDAASKLAGAKNVFFFGGSLYQVWRNTAGAVTLATPGGGGRLCMAQDDVFVLKHDPGRRPCWDVVGDLGGRSVFVGMNQPVVLRPEDAPGVRANCVYWINDRSRGEPMVFDMATRTSTIHPFADKALNPSWRPVCWYFLNDKSMKSVADNSGRKRHLSGDDCGKVLKSRKADQR